MLAISQRPHIFYVLSRGGGIEIWSDILELRWPRDFFSFSSGGAPLPRSQNSKCYKPKGRCDKDGRTGFNEVFSYRRNDFRIWLAVDWKTQRQCLLMLSNLFMYMYIYNKCKYFY